MNKCSNVQIATTLFEKVNQMCLGKMPFGFQNQPTPSFVKFYASPFCSKVVHIKKVPEDKQSSKYLDVDVCRCVF
jgi:hypothetical protein